jgi:hypothetical protein
MLSPFFFFLGRRQIFAEFRPCIHAQNMFIRHVLDVGRRSFRASIIGSVRMTLWGCERRRSLFKSTRGGVAVCSHCPDHFQRFRKFGAFGCDVEGVRYILSARLISVSICRSSRFSCFMRSANGRPFSVEARQRFTTARNDRRSTDIRPPFDILQPCVVART